MKNKLFELRNYYNLSIEQFCSEIEKSYSIDVKTQKVKLWEDNIEIIPSMYIHIFSNYFDVHPSIFGK